MPGEWRVWAKWVLGPKNGGDVFGSPREIYSGGEKDDDIERIEPHGEELSRWSVMGEGYHPEMEDRPMATQYFAFSLQELFTVEFNNVIDEAHGHPPR
jgi:hypothetical protein